MYQTMSQELDRLFEVQMAKEDKYEESAILPRGRAELLADRNTHGVPFTADRAAGRSAVDVALEELMNPWRSDDLPDSVHQMNLKQLLELRGELEAEVERLDELIEQLDEQVSLRPKEIEAELAALASRT